VEVGYWLGAGVLQLDLVDKDVKGSWIPKDPLGRRRPKPGDIYSRPLTLQSGHVQQFGHVGIVRTMEGSSWSSVDGGQGGRNGGKDYIKWVKRGKYHPKQINGWCDIDIYFSTLAKLGKK
jgi:hypothetical protein